MRIVQLTPGTGNFYCGHCLRDNALALALRARGHEVTMVPLYLPSITDESDASAGMPIFFGGINIYLQTKFAMLRGMPRWLERVIDSPALLRKSAQFAGMTSAKDLGELTVSMLRGELGPQAKEIERLLKWLISQPKPDVICLSTALLVGLVRVLKQGLHVPVVSSLQGEDSFLDSLVEPYRTQAWSLLAERAREVDLFIAVSGYFDSVMRERLRLEPERSKVIYNGITLEGFEPASSLPDPPVIGYLARMCKAKGLETLVDAFVWLRRRGRIPGIQLRIAGAKTPADESFVRALQQKLSHEYLAPHVQWLPNIGRLEKQTFLRSLSVLSVPATHGEAFGLYLLEALASAVPVVQPRHGAFPEILEATGGGIICEPNDAIALADAIETLLLDPATASEMGRRGRHAVQQRFGIGHMAEQMGIALNQVVAAAQSSHSLDA